MKQPKYITIDNYQQFKPSEFVRSFISDIESAAKTGMKMNMSSYVHDPFSGCLPCIGGMACLNMGGKYTFLLSLRPDVTEMDRIFNRIAMLGDAIRSGAGARSFLHDIRALYSELLPIGSIHTILLKGSKIKGQLRCFEGYIDPNNCQRLKKQIEAYATFLEELGL
jgi:hypothetical protein